jgi:hypothetical protein
MNLLAICFIYVRASGLISSGKMTLNTESGVGGLRKYKPPAQSSSMSIVGMKFVAICL